MTAKMALFESDFENRLSFVGESSIQQIKPSIVRGGVSALSRSGTRDKLSRMNSQVGIPQVE